MIILTGSTLGKRQRELNAKVKEATSKLINFNDIKDKAEESDVDRLFKIDLASKYLNIDYIIEILKSGDNLYISRALKCSWICGDSYSHIINVDNLHNNVIPFMSNKMKKKLLTAISTHVRDEVRAAEFYKYCMDSKLTAIALKFLNFTNDTFKLLVLNEQRHFNRLIFESKVLKNFIGLSFTLAEAYVKLFGDYHRIPEFRKLSYLYTVSEEKYLDLLEKYVKFSIYGNTYNTHLGLRISKSIMKRHKDRVFKKPLVYVHILSKNVVARYSTAEDAKIYAAAVLPDNILSKNVVARYSTAEDAKIYAAAVLPDNVEDFWSPNYCDKYKFLLDKITVGKFQYVKQIFTAKYPEECFETHPKFYHSQNYKIMTVEEQETWALQQIASENEILGTGNDYLWYKFVNFEKALEEIKKLVLITTDNTKRADMLLVLVNSAKTQRDVEKLLKYYHARHVNEQTFIKENFIDRVMQNFNVFEFDEDCWTAFNKMFHNLEVYNITEYNSRTKYRIVALFYCIINQKEVPEAIRKQLHSDIQCYTIIQDMDQLTKEQQQMVCSYLFKFCMDEIRKYENVPYEDDVKYHLRKYIHFTLDLLYDKTKEYCPELVNKFMKLDWSEFKYHRLLHDQSKKEITRGDLLRDLKKDAKLLVEHLPLVKTSILNSYRYDISAVLRKLKIYFSNDIAKDYLNLFETSLSEDRLLRRVSQAAVHGIFQLADEKSKVNFMAKYAPNDSKINHSEIDEKLLRIQKAICAHVCYSRPPVPLKSVLMYIKGDYVHFCLPIFDSYLANLPLPVCMEFVEAILDDPVSIQKHGLRLAFECFNAEKLNTLVLRAWNNTKNVSLRIIIFKALFNKICEVTTGQDLLFDTLKVLTLSLRPDDDDEIFFLLISPKLPEHLSLEYIEMAWKVVSQFPPNPANQKRLYNIIMYILCNKFDTIREEFIYSIIESFIATVFIQEEEYAIKLSSEASDLIDAKWHLTVTYILNVQGNDDLGKKMNFTEKILKKCLKDIGIREKKRALLKTCFMIIRELENNSYYQDFNCYNNVNQIMQLVLDTLEKTLPIEEIYMEVWEIRLGIVARKVLADSKIKRTDREQIDRGVIKEIANNFANELGILMKEFVEKEHFFAIFFSDIQYKITNKMETLMNLIDSKLEFTDMITYIFCLGLMSFKVTEIYLLVINLLPVSCGCEYEEEFKIVIKQLTKMDNKEIRCHLFRKLGNSDFDGCDFI